MFAEVARVMLTTMAKGEGMNEGAITKEQLPAAIAALKKAVAENATPLPREANIREEDGERPIPIGFSQRAYPLMELLERASAAKVDVIWRSVK